MDPPVGQRVYYQDRERGREYSKKYPKEPEMIDVDVSEKQPYQGGYRDFALWPAAGDPAPRTSMFDDIIYYWSKDPKDSVPGDNPLKSANYAKKIVAAMWINALEYIQKSVGAQECALEDEAAKMRGPSSEEDKRPEEINSSEEEKIERWLMFATSHAYKLKRRCLQFSDDMNNNMMELDLLLDLRKKDTQDTQDAQDAQDAQDWIYVTDRLGTWTNRSRVLINAISDLKTWKILEVGGRKAESTLVIQKLGTIYLPLSLTASLLSMGGNFSPGQSRFWIYFVVSLPLAVLSFTIINGWSGFRILKSRIAPCRRKRGRKAVVEGMEV